MLSVRRAIAVSVATLAILAAHGAPAAAAEFRSVIDGAAVLYDAPSAQSKKMFIVTQGYPLEVVVAVQGWVKVRDASGELSWVEASKVAAKPRTVMVRIAQAAVRQAPDDNAKVVFQANQNVILELSEVAGAWVRVRHRDGGSGFIRAPQVWGV
ncbi:MAG: hypothetical protein FJY56_10215 [Betaproteobacteria bacterium]|nr:hypothetical protein [Betaproteobacteria bacterium]